MHLHVRIGTPCLEDGLADRVSKLVRWKGYITYVLCTGQKSGASARVHVHSHFHISGTAGQIALIRRLGIGSSNDYTYKMVLKFCCWLGDKLRSFIAEHRRLTGYYLVFHNNDFQIIPLFARMTSGSSTREI